MLACLSNIFLVKQQNVLWKCITKYIVWHESVFKTWEALWRFDQTFLWQCQAENINTFYWHLKGNKLFIICMLCCGYVHLVWCTSSASNFPCFSFSLNKPFPTVLTFHCKFSWRSFRYIGSKKASFHKYILSTLGVRELVFTKLILVHWE